MNAGSSSDKHSIFCQTLNCFFSHLFEEVGAQQEKGDDILFLTPARTFSILNLTVCGYFAHVNRVFETLTFNKHSVFYPSLINT